MTDANRPGLLGAVIALGVVLALAAVVTTSNAPVHASSSPDMEVGTPSADDVSPYTGASFTLSATVTNAGDGESAGTTLRYYRLRIDGRPVNRGLGSYPLVTLAEARAQAPENARNARQGVDPMQPREVRIPTFGQATETVIRQHGRRVPKSHLTKR